MTSESVSPAADSADGLLPCPFCGGRACPPETDGNEMWQIDCASCCASGSYEHSEKEAIAAWNRRAPGWRPISEAERKSGAEILGSRWHGGKMTKEPFVSFWSPTLNKFYCDPTHFVPMPETPR